MKAESMRVQLEHVLALQEREDRLRAEALSMAVRAATHFDETSVTRVAKRFYKFLSDGAE